jgi:cytochrome o ubiquinol oxidase operon protein cyoD
MARQNHELNSQQATTGTYVMGFVLSLILTLTAFFIVSRHGIHGNALIFSLAGLAVIQFLVQLIFFLHLESESKPRWNLTALIFALGVVIIIVAGSLWIMYHLNYNMNPTQTNTYIQQEENIYK